MNNNTINNQKKWRIRPSVPALSHIFTRKLGISPIMAQLLINRGIYTVEHARDYLSCKLERMHSPDLLCDMAKAVARILKAIQLKEKILVYGDYDVDGITATALIIRVFQLLGVTVEYYIPNRLTEGYGLQLDVIKQAVAKGISLIITLDCGISSRDEALWSSLNGLDLIITDHHEPPADLPEAFAVINPKRPDCNYPFRELAGVGVALKLAQALLEQAGAGSLAWREFLDLACLGTLADIVPVLGENRIIVKHGLKRLASTQNVGLQALIAVSELKGPPGPHEVGFALAPRLNAAGRMKSPELALKLLLAENMAEAMELATVLNNLNKQRQKIESEVLDKIKKMLAENPGLAEERVLVLASPGWHVGVIGIVASRLVITYKKPVFLISLQDNEGRGSARSVPYFNLHQALTHCRALLLNYGGHAEAAGFSIEKGKVEEFRRELNQYAREVLKNVEQSPSCLELDGIVSMEQVSEELVRELDMLRPYGHRNPDPVLGCRRARVVKCRSVGRGAAHLKLLFKSRNRFFEGIGFNLGAYAETLATVEEVDLAFIPGINEFNGKSAIQLEVKELGLPAVVVEDKLQHTVGLTYGTGYLPAERITGKIEELFISEFIILQLRNALKKPAKHGRMDKITGKPVRIVDWRDINDRPAVLKEITIQGESTVVIVSGGYRTIELALFLQLAVPVLKGKVVFCHGLSTDNEKNIILNDFREGLISTIIATPAVARELGQLARHVVVYDLPYDNEDLCCAIKTICPGGYLYLLFGADDYKENKKSLRELAPDRQVMVSLYKILQRENNRGNLENCTIDFIVGSMKAAGYPWLHQDTLRACLNILEELGLLKINGADKRTVLELIPPPLQKKNLMEAATYKYLHHLKEHALSWMKMFIDAPLCNGEGYFEYLLREYEKQRAFRLS